MTLAALDQIKTIVAALSATHAEPAGDDATLIAALDRAAEGRGSETTPPVAAPVVVPGEAAPAGGPTIRVAVDVLEHLMTLVSELVLTRNQLLQLARTQQNSAFAVPLQRLSHITTDCRKAS